MFANMKIQLNLMVFIYFLMHFTMVIMLPTKDVKDYHDFNETLKIHAAEKQNGKIRKDI